MHLILICVKCTIFLEISSFLFHSYAFQTVLIFSSLSHCQSFLHASYIKSETFFLASPLRSTANRLKNSFNFTSNIVHEKWRGKTVTDILQFADAPANPFVLVEAIFYTKSNRIRVKVDYVDTQDSACIAVIECNQDYFPPLSLSARSHCSNPFPI